MNYKKSLEVVEKALIELKEKNKSIPIVVEGEKDRDALRSLDFTGVIINVNSGKTIIDFCDYLARKYREIILLTDWDRKGGSLCRRIKQNLKGRVKCNVDYRAVFAKNAMTKTIEGLPSWISTMRNKSVEEHV